MRISRSSSSIMLEIEDDGKGFKYDPDSNIPTLGLKGMKERTEQAGGSFSISSEMNKGTKITIILPCNGKGEAEWRK